MTTQEIISRAREKCDADESIIDENWHDAVEAEIRSLADTDESADMAICTLNRQLFGSAGLI